jgi:hypothetical protein
MSCKVLHWHVCCCHCTWWRSRSTPQILKVAEAVLEGCDTHPKKLIPQVGAAVTADDLVMLLFLLQLLLRGLMAFLLLFASSGSLQYALGLSAAHQVRHADMPQRHYQVCCIYSRGTPLLSRLLGMPTCPAQCCCCRHLLRARLQSSCCCWTQKIMKQL